MNRIASMILVAVMVLLVTIPLYPLVLNAFSLNWTYPNLLPDDFTFVSFELIDSYFDIYKILAQSIILSAIVTLGSIVLGYYPAKLIGTHDFRGKRLLEIVLIIPALASAITVIFGLIPVMRWFGIYKTFIGLVLGQMTFALPYFIITTSSSFRNYETMYEELAPTLGLSNFEKALFVTMPQMKSGIAVGAMYTFIVSWSMFLFTDTFAPRAFETMATVLYPQVSSMVNYHYTAAITLLFFIPALVMMVISTRIVGSDNTNIGGGQ